MKRLALKRLPDWEERLSAYIKEVRLRIARDGAAGELCALFAAGGVEAVTGRNPARRFRGRYADSADRLEEIVDALLPAVPPALAQRGDVVLHDGSLGVCFGADALFVGEAEALVRIPRAGWLKAWGVGRG